MTTMRKRIVSKALTRDSHLFSTFPKYQVKSRASAPKIPDLEHYISAVCECVENNSKLPAQLLKQGRSMLLELERGLSDCPDFSYDFYLIVKDFLKTITETKTKDYSSLTVHLLKLGEFMQESKETPKASKIENLAALISASDLTEMASAVENTEPFKTICLVFLKVFSSVDDSIPANCLHFASKAVNFVKVYLKTPDNALLHIRNTQKYMDNGEIYIGNHHLENIDATRNSLGNSNCKGSTKKVYQFLKAVIETYGDKETNESFSTIQQSLSGSIESCLKGQDHIINLRSEIFDQHNTETFDVEEKRTLLSKFKQRQTSEESDTAIASFDRNPRSDQCKFRLDKSSRRKNSLACSTSWRELQIQREKAKLNANMNKYNKS